MTDTEIRRTIDGALRDVRVMDPHCHLDAQKPVARTLADILLYHHVWIELISAGMGQKETNLTGLPHELVDPGLPPEERVRRALPWLPRIRNSTISVLLRWLLEDVYGFHGKRDPAGIEGLSELVARRGAEADWPDRLFGGTCGIERLISVEKKRKIGDPRIERANEALGWVNLSDGRRGPRAMLSDMEALLGRDVRSASDIGDVLKKVIDALPVGDLRFLGAWVLPYITPQRATDAEVTRIIARAREGTPLSPDELGSVTYFGMTRALELLR